MMQNSDANSKSFASLSLDLDNKWSYLKTHGEKDWDTFPSYLDVVVPRILDFLKERDIKITFFIVGQDAALEKNHAALRAITDAGHEVGNHSFKHEPWLHLFSEEEILAELSEADKNIQQATGQKPIGFRGPGFSLSLSTLRVLKRMGYAYDCSTFPTFLGPLARLYYQMTAKFTPEEKAERSKLFGTINDGLRPNKPYRWQFDDTELTEIPVTTMPIFKVPIHVSYILYLATYSRFLALTYFRFALLMCRLTGVEPSLLLHPTDFLGSEDEPELAFFPAMKMSIKPKLEVVSEVLRMLGKHHRIVGMYDYAQRVNNQKPAVPLVPSKFY